MQSVRHYSEIIHDQNNVIENQMLITLASNLTCTSSVHQIFLCGLYLGNGNARGNQTAHD